MNNQKEDNNQSKINKQPEAPENQTAWNSDNQGIKEKNQPEQPGQCAKRKKYSPNERIEQNFRKRAKR